MRKRNEPLLDPPRWQGGPPICNYENLPAYVTVKEMKHWQEQNHMAIAEFAWKCHVCGMYHDKFVGISRLSGSGSVVDKFLKPYQVRAEREGHVLEKLV